MQILTNMFQKIQRINPQNNVAYPFRAKIILATVSWVTKLKKWLLTPTLHFSK